MSNVPYVVIVNSPVDEDGIFKQYVNFIDKLSYHGIKNGTVLWDTRSMGDVRGWDTINEVFYTIPWYDLQAFEGTFLKAYGGNNNGIPYIDNFTQDGFVDDWLEGHKQWMLANYRLPLEVWMMKAYLHGIPDGGGTLLETINAEIEATYATEPLNKVRWEEREFMHWGDPLYLIIFPYVDLTHFDFRNDFEWSIPGNHNEYNENNIT